jgi:hypothetical protein
MEEFEIMPELNTEQKMKQWVKDLDTLAEYNLEKYKSLKEENDESAKPYGLIAVKAFDLRMAIASHTQEIVMEKVLQEIKEDW